MTRWRAAVVGLHLLLAAASALAFRLSHRTHWPCPL